ncbi:Cof-type HAD-IIB family hydrolase [Georgenia satyanarayanai]|uniref:HAD family hydrolase n=1 Tax=Georgenia satyanarayanai TaxID=860221 RepID=UPI00203EB74A|nr:HAD family hydrolase [Georgenia satyanarayanai]MCM3659801.1 Cof-type HAD-IIB family hydrolase [Georgenia satyanarayanai]
MKPWPEFVPRLVATDIDGTILPHGGTVSARTRTALQEYVERGLDVVLVTGRPPRWLPPVVEATSLTGPVIAANGAMVVDAQSLEPIEISAIPPEQVVEAVARFTAELPDAAFAVETPGELRVGPGFERLRTEGRREGLTPDEPPVTQASSVAELLDGADIIKVMVLSPASDPDEMLATGRAEAGDLVSVTRSGVGRPLLELGPHGVSKATALALYARARQIDQADVVAFGDMPNDVEMLRWAGHGFAMHGGHAEALAAAEHVAPPVGEDGVAQVLEALLVQRAALTPIADS